MANHRRSKISGKFQPLPDGTQLTRKQVMLRPDQVERLALDDNQSQTVRNALDMYWTVHPAPVEHYAAIDASIADDDEDRADRLSAE